MDRIGSAIAITLSQYPWIGKEDLVRLFTDYIETHLEEIVAKAAARVELPSRMELKREWFKEQRKPERIRRPMEKLKKREAFVKWLEEIKSEKRERPIDADFLVETDGWSGNVVMQLMERPFASPERETWRDIYFSKDFEDGLQRLGDHTFLKAISKAEGAVNIEEIQGERLDEMIELISKIARDISQNRVERISHCYDDDFGFIIEIVMRMTDKEAFETWLRLIEELKNLGLESLVTVDWTGENVLSKDELVHKTVDVMLKLGIRPKLTERVDVKKELEEEWL